MPTQVLMPQLGESVVEGTLTKWLKSKGDPVEQYEPLLEINTDKVDTEVPSPVTGVLLQILIPEGTVVQAGQNLAWIGEAGESPPEGEPATAYPNEIPLAKPTPVATKTTPASPIPQVEVAPGRNRDLGFISPVVAKIASERNVDLNQVTGSGQNGRITKVDILAYIASRGEIPASPSAQTAAAAASPIPGEILPMTPVRRLIAEHMVRSKHTSPHVTTVMEADFSRVVAHRLENKERLANEGVNLTFSAYFVAATVVALKAFPITNSSWSEKGIVLHRQINIGMAASLGDEGLIVPVIKNADSLSLTGIARSVNDLASRARARQLKPDEVQGGTFTITNHGVSGSLFATPIINQPQAGILGVGAVQKRVVVISDEINGDTIAIRPMVYLTCTFDHRILDGAIADYFLAKIVDTLQNWT